MTEGLRSVEWPRFVQGPDKELLDRLYVPGLSIAVRYDRCCAYFSSSVLASAALGFANLIKRLESMGGDAPHPAVRFLVNEQLERADAEALMERGDAGPLEALLSKRLKTPLDVLTRDRLSMLGWLVKSGLLEARVGVMRSSVGILHAKWGIFYDGDGDGVVFAGSGNESATALHGSYDHFEVTGTWKDPERQAHFEAEFELLWNDRHASVHVVPLPEAIKQRLIKFAPPVPPVLEPTDDRERQRAAMLWQYLVEAPYLEGGAATCDATTMIDLWPHQGRVIEEAAAAWPEGRLLCDEVGLGKTIEAVLVLRRLIAGRGVRRALLLLPAGLLRQWQAELREKGGLVIPRLEGLTRLVWPDGSEKKVAGLAEALQEDLLLLSRETARTETNSAELFAAEAWDLVLLDEAHAARRRKQEEGGFNSGTLLLDLLRQLQLRRKVRGFLFLSATPMQTDPWEPWDLLSVLGEGGAWLSEFDVVRDYYETVRKVETGGPGDKARAQRVSEVVSGDVDFPPLSPPDGPLGTPAAVANRLQFPPPSRRPVIAGWLRKGSPLARRMHRTTRATLRKYYTMGLLEAPPPIRRVDDVVFDYLDQAERNVYDEVRSYVERRFRELEAETKGKGFVMTIYRRRASSSPLALKRSLERRADGLQRVARSLAYDFDVSTLEELDPRDLDEAGSDNVSAAFPANPRQAEKELRDVQSLLRDLEALGYKDSKRDRFFDLIRELTDAGRAVLVFSEYSDTVDYLRDWLTPKYGFELGCYTGDGGKVWDGTDPPWRKLSKDAITRRLREGHLRVLVCNDAASEGLNLQAASALINYDLPWNPSKVEQRIGRVDRIGQKFPDVRVANLLLRNSVDEQVYRALHARCELFEHFIGPMQPVLSRARQMLLGQAHFDLAALNHQADEVDANPLARETYVESDAEAPPPSNPAVTRRHIWSALSNLPSMAGLKFKVGKDGSTGVLSGPGLRKARFGSSTEALDADSSLLPAEPIGPVLREVADLFRRPECLPLMVAVAERGPFRHARAIWVQTDGESPLTSVDDLIARLDAWDGSIVEPVRWAAIQRDAAKSALASVEAAAARADVVEAAAMARQVDATRRRLLLELGRYLACVDPTLDDPNAAYARQMERTTQDAIWLRDAFARLGGYPEWSESTLRNLREFAGSLGSYQVQNRITGTQLKAALDDPRWAAAPRTP